eukprot:TRINITY_DN4092_c0_g1_i4.p1 TRINITY_DN4092_c0_g1~~TRINITY_DN4092_c0_g1_i4.p1  ORF type:complete len:228 (+),score=-22.05 TRINITY_DN4092_c0_g1_i4:463-1146(+)
MVVFTTNYDHRHYTNALLWADGFASTRPCKNGFILLNTFSAFDFPKVQSLTPSWAKDALAALWGQRRLDSLTSMLIEGGNISTVWMVVSFHVKQLGSERHLRGHRVCLYLRMSICEIIYLLSTVRQDMCHKEMWVLYSARQSFPRWRVRGPSQPVVLDGLAKLLAAQQSRPVIVDHLVQLNVTCLFILYNQWFLPSIKQRYMYFSHAQSNSISVCEDYYTKGPTLPN